MPYDVLLVDNHKILREGVKALIERQQEFHVAAEAETGPDAIQACQRMHLDLVVMEIGLPGLNGIDTTKAIVSRHPEMKVIMLSRYDDEDSVMGAMRAGASGFVAKTVSSSDLIDALRTAMHGGCYLASHVFVRLLTRIQSGDMSSHHRSHMVDKISLRERQVLSLISEGKTSNEAAAILELGVTTVRSHRKSLMRKLGVKNVATLLQMTAGAGIGHWGELGRQ